MRYELTHVEKLVAEKAELEKREREIESFRMAIRMNQNPILVEAPLPQLKRILWRRSTGREPDLTPVPESIVSEFYGYLNSQLDAARSRILNINNELKDRSKTNDKES